MTLLCCRTPASGNSAGPAKKASWKTMEQTFKCRNIYQPWLIHRIHPLLKIVPNKCIISSCLIAAAWGSDLSFWLERKLQFICTTGREVKSERQFDTLETSLVKKTVFVEKQNRKVSQKHMKGISLQIREDESQSKSHTRTYCDTQRRQGEETSEETKRRGNEEERTVKIRKETRGERREKETRGEESRRWGRKGDRSW